MRGEFVALGPLVADAAGRSLVILRGSCERRAQHPLCWWPQRGKLPPLAADSGSVRSFDPSRIWNAWGWGWCARHTLRAACREAIPGTAYSTRRRISEMSRELARVAGGPPPDPRHFSRWASSMVVSQICCDDRCSGKVPRRLPAGTTVALRSRLALILHSHAAGVRRKMPGFQGQRP